MLIILYIDLGAGSMLIQAVLAGIIAIPFFFRSTISQAVIRLRKRRTGEENAGPSLKD